MQAFLKGRHPLILRSTFYGHNERKITINFELIGHWVLLTEIRFYMIYSKYLIYMYDYRNWYASYRFKEKYAPAIIEKSVTYMYSRY